MNDPLGKWFLTLLELGSLPHSRTPQSAQSALQTLRDTGAVASEGNGRGARWRVKNAEAVRALALRLRPSLGEEVPTTRAGSVAQFRDSKRNRAKSKGTPVFLRPLWADAIQLNTPDGQLVDLVKTAEGTGLAALTAKLGWRAPSPIKIGSVENLEMFQAPKSTFGPLDALLYTQGRLAQETIQFLGDIASEVVHFGDYDPVGLDEFRRLHAVLGTRALLHIPDNLPDLFARFSNPALLEENNNRAVLARLLMDRDQLPNSVQQVLTLIQEYGAALEQEVLLI